MDQLFATRRHVSKRYIIERTAAFSPSRTLVFLGFVGFFSLLSQDVVVSFVQRRPDDGGEKSSLYAVN